MDAYRRVRCSDGISAYLSIVEVLDGRQCLLIIHALHLETPLGAHICTAMSGLSGPAINTSGVRRRRTKRPNH